MGTDTKGAAGKKGAGTGWRPRLCHWRGHGIHSPLVYSLVRNVFMNSSAAEGDTALYDELILRGVRKSIARRIHILYYFSDYVSFTIDDVSLQAGGDPGDSVRTGFTGRCLHVITPMTKPEDAKISPFPPEEGTLCVITGRSARKKRICRKMVDNHSGISIDSRSFFLYFYARPERKQHYKI